MKPIKKKTTLKKPDKSGSDSTGKTSVRNKKVVLKSNSKAPTKPTTKKKASASRKSSAKVSYLFDQAVPEELLFKGVVKEGFRKGAKPTIQTTTEINLSPYVIHLNTEVPSPQEIIDHESKERQLNFLVPEHELYNDPLLAEITRDSLSLYKEDIAGQLEEEDFTSQISHLKKTLSVFKQTKERTQNFLSALRPQELEIVTTALPEDDIATWFDLPEEESEEESEIVVFDNMELIVEDDSSEEPEKKKRWKPIEWKWGFLFEMQTGWQKTIAAFVLVSFVFVLPIHAMNTLQELRSAKASLEQSGAEAITQLQAGTNAALTKNIGTAEERFTVANQIFTSAESTLGDLSKSTSLLLSVLPQTRSSYTNGRTLIKVGESLSRAGTRITEGIIAMDTPIDTPPTTKIKILIEHLQAALPHLLEAQEHLQNINVDDIPVEYRSTLLTTQNSLPFVTYSIQELLSFSDIALDILGANKTQRYLAVFQNNMELRPTGGFIGSFAQIDLRNGEIERMEIPGGGSYDLQGSQKQYLVAPKPLQLINARWEFQDSNWFPDFPTSSRQMIDFYNSSGGPTVDGVIAINASFIASLLDFVGEIELSEYDRVFTAENFIFEAQKIAEIEYAQYEDIEDEREEEAPKAFLGELAPRLLKAVMQSSPEQFLEIFDHFVHGLKTRQVQLYFEDEDRQKNILDRDWGGDIKQTDGDYLMVVDTNLGGGKTDGVIESTFDLHVQIHDNGEIINTLKVTRDHKGIANNLFTGVNNVDYMRVYVPSGSELLDASGFSIPDKSLFERPDAEWEVDDDVFFIEDGERTHYESGTSISESFGKTVFGNWVQTKPGTVSTAIFTYRLPFRIHDSESATSFFQKLKTQLGLTPAEAYTLMIQKQSGALNRNVNISVETPEHMNKIWTSQEGSSVEFPLEKDMFYSILLEQL